MGRRTAASPPPPTGTWPWGNDAGFPFALHTDPIISQWAFGLLALHVVLQLALVYVPPFQKKAGVAAHQIVVAIPFAYAAWFGGQLWITDDGIAAAHRGDYTSRLYGANEPAWALCRFMIGFQLYDLLATGLVAELRKAEHLAHHSASIFTALAGAAAGGPFFLYYVPFFFGFTEISSVPLAAVDLFREFPSLAKGRIGAGVNEAVRSLFGVSFLLIRCVLFPWVMLSKFWPDLAAAFGADDVRGASRAPFYWMIFSSTFLTLLQFFWGGKIVRVLLKGNLSGRDQGKAAKET